MFIEVPSSSVIYYPGVSRIRNIVVVSGLEKSVFRQVKDELLRLNCNRSGYMSSLLPIPDLSRRLNRE